LLVADIQNEKKTDNFWESARLQTKTCLLYSLSGKKYTLTIAQDGYAIIASEHSTVWTKLNWAEEVIDGRITDTLTIEDKVSLFHFSTTTNNKNNNCLCLC
jgi:hypothetical protein